MKQIISEKHQFSIFHKIHITFNYLKASPDKTFIFSFPKNTSN
jgi:hypothetical protein